MSGKPDNCCGENLTVNLDWENKLSIPTELSHVGWQI